MSTRDWRRLDTWHLLDAGTLRTLLKRNDPNGNFDYDESGDSFAQVCAECAESAETCDCDEATRVLIENPGYLALSHADLVACARQMDEDSGGAFGEGVAFPRHVATSKLTLRTRIVIRRILAERAEREAEALIASDDREAMACLVRTSDIAEAPGGLTFEAQAAVEEALLIHRDAILAELEGRDA